MANSSQIKTGLDTLLQSHVSMTVKNTLFNRMPVLYFLFARDGNKTGPDGLGRPKVNGQSPGIFLSGVTTAKARKETILGARVYEPKIQTSTAAVADGKTMTMADNMPVRTNWEGKLTSGYFTAPRVKWCERVDPYKVSNKEIRTTTSAAPGEATPWKAIVSLMEAEVETVTAVHEKFWNQTLWGTTGTGSPSNEDAAVWDNLYSIRNALSTTNTYCGVDRSLAPNAYWKGGSLSGYGTVVDFEKIINYCNYSLGMAAVGMGVDLILCDGTNFQKAKAEAKSKGGQVIYAGTGIPDFGQFGFKREMVKIDNTWIVYDPECPTGEMALLNLSTWTFAIHPDANFKVTKPFDQSQIEGGDDAMAGVIRTEILLACEVPSMNAYGTSMTN